MWRKDAQQVDLPDGDFWISDSHLVAILVFDDDDNLTGAEFVTEPAAVNQYNRLRDVALHYDVPYKQFAASVAAKEAKKRVGPGGTDYQQVRETLGAFEGTSVLRP